MPAVELDDTALQSALESILLVAGGPATMSSLAAALGMSASRVRAAAERVARERTGGIRLQIDRDQVQLVTAPENVEVVHRFLGTSRPPALGRAALETLAVIAYRQPVTRPELENLRGANSDRAVQTLLARGLIEERGVRQTLGRPTEYGTTFAFLEYFCLTSLTDLPPLPPAAEGTASLEDVGMRPENPA